MSSGYRVVEMAVGKKQVRQEIRFLSDESGNFGQARWLTLVIPALWEAEVGESPEVGSWRPA